MAVSSRTAAPPPSARTNLQPTQIAGRGAGGNGSAGSDADCATEALRVRAQASNSALDAYTDPILSWWCRRTGIASRFSQRWTVVTSRFRYAAISFHDS